MFNSHWFELFENTPNLSGQLLQDISAKIFWSPKTTLLVFGFFDIFGVILTGHGMNRCLYQYIDYILIHQNIYIHISYELEHFIFIQILNILVQHYTLVEAQLLLVQISDIQQDRQQFALDYLTYAQQVKMHILTLPSLFLWFLYFWPLWQNAHLAKMHICTYYTKMLIIK